ncbi:DUF6447 family protein [Sabulicella glaciei]|uniref:DUF6447 family protein n=1 Tax=Sabulicella glaciei TaxID=2984948 RepID=A0ABT3NXC8_9PROT|nr:DUF6447 family protein [Roseococcus sp. MDT2-1-1]MCW8086827.1 DUF6447 family protein [Roseococcus sp. MDT2-1-1]
MPDRNPPGPRVPGPLLPQEPAPVSRRAHLLAARHLWPARAALMDLFLALRAETDAAMGGSAPAAYGKPYPYGYCREITLHVFEALQRRMERPGCRGSRALQAFLAKGGEGRCVWGILRDTYFQTALQFGALYVDVANDTVDPAKPRVEILPMAEAGLEPVRDAFHFAGIAKSYWGMTLYANHALPALAPVVPMIGVMPDGAVSFPSATVYMAGLFLRDGFRLAEEWLASAPPPPEGVIALLRSRLSAGGLAAHPETGGKAALAACRDARARGLASDPKWVAACLAECERFGAGGNAPNSEPIATPVAETRAMSTITFEGRSFALDTLSEAARAQVAGIQFVEGEIARLQARLAAMQTARNAYVEALRAALPAE